MTTHHVAYVKDQQVIMLQNAIGNLPAEGLDENGYTVVHVDFQISERSEWMKTHYWDGSVWQTREAAPNDYCTWDATTSTWTWDNETVMTQVRFKRNTKLRASDWTQMADSPLTDAKKTEWADYRQSLRDLPLNQSSPASLEVVVWPTEPA